MIRIAITPAAHAAIAATMALGTVAVEPEHAKNGDITSGSILASWPGSKRRAASFSRDARRGHGGPLQRLR
jgi:hypothetical protein